MEGSRAGGSRRCRGRACVWQQQQRATAGAAGGCQPVHEPWLAPSPRAPSPPTRPLLAAWPAPSGARPRATCQPRLDHLAMITVQHPKHGLFDCKPLQFIWSKVGGRAGLIAGLDRGCGREPLWLSQRAAPHAAAAAAARRPPICPPACGSPAAPSACPPSVPRALRPAQHHHVSPACRLAMRALGQLPGSAHRWPHVPAAGVPTVCCCLPAPAPTTRCRAPGWTTCAATTC